MELRHHRTGLARLAVAAVGLMALVAPPAAHGTFPGRDGLIAVGGGGFWFDCHSLNLRVISPDGTGLRRLTPTGECVREEAWAPSWSADGQRIAFVNGSAIGVMSADGSGAREVYRPAEPISLSLVTASISPDGLNVAFDADVLGRARVWTASLDGTNAHIVARGRSPSWSPDGRLIAYVTQHGRVGLLDVITGRSVLMRRFARRAESLDWSPDGRRLLLVMEGRRSFRLTLATVTVHAATVGRPSTIRLPHWLRAHWLLGRAVWSPSGRRIALIAYQGGHFGIARPSVWVMPARGGRLERVLRGSLTDDDLPADSLSWQPR